jgi:4-amino-4-deoxy-L-arabinose transferase-like glycosyltransferase
MFTDGVLYAAVSHNLAKGMGSFWHPYFNETMFPFFHQQPPLTFGIQAIFFKIFGDSRFVERGYSFMTMLITSWLISCLWRIIFYREEKVRKIAWLPLIVWIIIPVCLWSYSNNLEENTMGVFSLTSVILIYRGLRVLKYGILYMVLGGICISLAFLCKGFPGIFAVTLPFCYWLTKRSVSFIKMTGYSLAIFITIACIYAILLSNESVRDSLTAYLNDRVINSIKNVATTGNRFFLIERLFFIEFLPPMGLSIIFYLLFNKQLSFNAEFIKREKADLILFALIGISASLPLIITREQREFYLVTSLPYYAIVFAMINAGALSEKISHINVQWKSFKAFKILSILFFTCTLIYSFSLTGATGRDNEQLHDIYLFGNIIPNNTTIRVFHETWQDWGLHNYLVRYFNISMAEDTSSKYKFFIVDRNLHKLIPPEYSKITLNTLEYDLYEKKMP